MTIEPINLEDQLFTQLRSATVQRLRAAQRGDDGLCVLLHRQRVHCLEALGCRTAPRRRWALSAA